MKEDVVEVVALIAFILLPVALFGGCIWALVLGNWLLGVFLLALVILYIRFIALPIIGTAVAMAVIIGAFLSIFLGALTPFSRPVKKR